MFKKKWKRIEKTNYWISNYGEVWSEHCKRNLKCYTNISGTLMTTVSIDCDTKHLNLSKEVVKYFKKEWTLDTQYATHNDFNLENNKEPNLECASRGDLLRYRHRHQNKIKGIHKRTIRPGYTYYSPTIKYQDRAVTVGYFKTEEERSLALCSGIKMISIN